MASDPIELVHVVERAMADRWRAEDLHNDSDPEVYAWVALDAVLKTGWRIVRVTDWNEQTGTIAEEWTPDGN